MRIRRTITTPLSLALAAVLCSCGDSATNDVASKIPTQRTVRAGFLTYNSDRDNDNDHNNDDRRVLNFGHAAGAGESRAIAAHIKRYYAAQASGSGRRACALLIPFVAETVAEQYGGTATLKGHDCDTVMSEMFAKRRRELINKQASLRIVRIGVEGEHSLVALDFPEIPEVRQITMRHSHGRWYVLSLLDGIIE